MSTSDSVNKKVQTDIPFVSERTENVDVTPLAPAPKQEIVEYPIDLKERSQQHEIDMIKQALADSQFNQKKTAEKLSLTYHQLRGYLKKYNLLDSSAENVEA